MTRLYDIVINGGGIVGFTLLNLLAKSPYLSRARVLLIEQANQPCNLQQLPRIKNNSEDSNNAKAFSNRVSSINHASRRAFKHLGVWNTVRPFAKDVIKIHVWNYDYNNKIDFRQYLPNAFLEDKEERDVMFSTVENNRLSNALLDNLINNLGKAGTISWSSQLEKLEESLDCGLIDVSFRKENSEGLQTVSAPLVLGCDGYRSKVRELSKMCYKEIDLKKTAVVGTVKMSTSLTNSENNVAYQRFSSAKDTVAALLPLDSKFSSFVISAPPEYSLFLRDCDEQTFVQEFNQLLNNDEEASNPFLRGLHEVSNAAYDNLKAALQVIRPRIGFNNGTFADGGFDEKPSVEHVMKDSRATFPLVFGTTSPIMVTTLPGLNRKQIALLGDASHRVHPLAGQGLNLGIQDAVELVRQLESIAESGEMIFDNIDLLKKALKKYELKRQMYVVPMLASILAMQDLFKLLPSRAVSSLDKCQPIKTLSVRMADG